MKPLLAAAGCLVSLTVAGLAQDRPRDLLATYLRTGQYADASRLMDAILRTQASPDLENVRAMFGGGPNMRVTRRAASFACEVSETGVLLPVTVNGRRVDWLLDTGANATVISDAEAKRLGLVVRGPNGRMTDLAGGSIEVRTAVARRVVIGRSELENVLLLTTPADQLPWNELPEGKQGILGLPLAIALDALRWTREGMCHTGSAAVLDRSASQSNLRYDQLQLISQVEFDGRTLEFVLDTGNQAGTQLWARFKRDFAALITERGRKGSVRVTQIGSAGDHPVIVIPDLRLKVGDRETVLEEAPLFEPPVGDDRFHGLLGMDVLRQASQVTIDFRALRLTLQKRDRP